MARYKPYDYKAFVTGPYQSGKTHLIHSLDPEAISIDRPITKPKCGTVGTTTTCFDLGRIVWLRNGSQEMIMPKNTYLTRKDEFRNWLVREIELRGVPGSLPFKPVRDVMRPNSDVVIMVVDASDRTMISEARQILAETREAHASTPIEVIASKQDVCGAASPQEVANWLGVAGATGLVSTDGDQCAKVLMQALKRLEH